MLYRIDLEHFLTHAIDHFTREELLSMQYAIISAGIRNGGRENNMTKFNYIYPSMNVQEIYLQYKTKDSIKKAYCDELKERHKDLYLIFVANILKHVDIVIICQESENVYIDILCEYLAKVFKIECIDLNRLFIEGKVGPIYIDRRDIKDKAVDIRLEAAKERNESIESTSDGRMVRLGEMSKSEKLKKLKELGIVVNKNEYDSIDKLLIEAWVEDE